MKSLIKLKKSKYHFFFTILPFFILFITSTSFSQQKITGLSDWNIYLDPGHSQFENMGIYGYSEAEKNLRVGLNLRQMLLDWTDIDTVYICRTNDQQVVGLTQRTDQANSFGATHYHSIHSDAGGTTANSTLIMWGQMGIGGPEKTPYGGKKMSNIMVGLLTAGMRTNTRGAMGDRDFYGVAGSTPYLSVNRNSTMASELSEAGFHTNPTQNQLNMNAKWKRLEAKTMFWTILKYNNIPRPFAGTVVGIIKDIESGLAINGAIVTLDGQTDTTDTYESLFYKYSTNPNQLRNGFYYFENIPPGSYQLQVTAPGFENYSTNVTPLDTFFTFQDVNLISTSPPTVISTDPVSNDSLYPGMKNITIKFSRPINRSTVDSNIIFTPNVNTNSAWSNNDMTLTINTANFANDTVYQIDLKGAIEDNYGHQLDGNNDGTGGDDYTFSIRTEVADILPPLVKIIYPDSNSTNIELKPIINVSFNEPLKTSTVSSNVKIIRNSTQTAITSYLTKYYTVNGKSVLNFFISSPLAENETYTVKILAGVQDSYGNATTNDFTSEFTTGNSNYISRTIIDDFNAGIAAWWQPEASGSTIGVLPDLTSASSVSSILNISTSSTKSLMLDYGYDEAASDWLIRQYRSVTTPSFDKNGLLQVFIFGDGNYNKFRFCVREINGTSPANLEVSPWYNIDWIGWKAINWDLTEGQTGTWLGNGVLEPPFIFDSFQFSYQAGNISQGTYYIDDLRIATLSPTEVKQEDIQLPISFALEQNYPNPFNPSTQIKFSIAKSSNVKLIVNDILGREVAILVDEEMVPGNYSLSFNAKNISSGVYFYTLITDNFKQSRKMILMK
jgi:N-acetylmuramoyl-L-alanine amidase